MIDCTTIVPYGILQGTKTTSQPFFSPIRAMADTKHSPSESSPHGPEILVNADLEIAILVDTECIDAHDGSLDPTYVAKAKVPNDAFREIGIGRCQVSLLWTLVSAPHLCVTPLFSGIFLSSPVLAGCRMCPYYSLALCTTSSSMPLRQRQPMARD